MIARAYHANAGGGLPSLDLREHEVAKPGRRQALVRMVATSLNYRERMILVDGVYPLPIKPDLIPLCDGAGDVIAIGPDVTRVRVGDRVAANVFARWIDGPFAFAHADQLGGSLDGLLTEYALLDDDAFVAIPPHLSYEEAAAFPCAGVTAWNAITAGGALLPGQTVLVQGSGSVSVFGLQFAKLFGARVIATTSSKAKAPALREIGADDVIDSREIPDWDRAVRELMSGRGADRAIDVGGPTTLARSIAALAPDGHVALVGGLGGSAALDPAALAGVFRLQRIALGNRAHFEAMNRAVCAAQLRPIIDRAFAFDDAHQAFRYFFERDAIGKVIIRVRQ